MSKFCVKCGANLNDRDIFCPYCGEENKNFSNNDNNVNQNIQVNINKKKNKNKMIIFVSLIIIFSLSIKFVIDFKDLSYSLQEMYDTGSDYSKNELDDFSNNVDDYIDKKNKSKDELKNLKAKSKKIPYIELLKSPQKYVKENINFTGKVVEAHVEDNVHFYKINVNIDEYGNYVDTIFIGIDDEYINKENIILKNDIVKIYGFMVDNINYNDVSGEEVVAPFIYCYSYEM